MFESVGGIGSTLSLEAAVKFRQRESRHIRVPARQLLAQHTRDEESLPRLDPRELCVGRTVASPSARQQPSSSQVFLFETSGLSAAGIGSRSPESQRLVAEPLALPGQRYGHR